jgi:hypothetical protein
LLTTSLRFKPSEADTKGTRDFIRAGKIVNVEVLDRGMAANSHHCSLHQFERFSTRSATRQPITGWRFFLNSTCAHWSDEADPTPPWRPP